jgi:ribosomal protein S27AE
MKSEETINKNNIEIEERAKKSAAGLLDLFEKIRGYNTSLKCEINRSELLERNYNGCKKQYAILYARYAKRASFIRVAAEMKDTSIKAKGFLKESYINRLKTDSKRLMGAIDPTIRLIEISASSGDKQGFNTAKSEAISLLNNLKRYKSACDRAKKALSSVARASAIANNYQSVNSEIIKDEQAYSSLIQEMGGYIRLQQAIDRKSREFYGNIIKNTQIFKRASAYFIKHTENTDVISQVKLLQVRVSVYEPSEYDIKKIKERTNLLIGNFTHLRDIPFNKIEFSSSDVADIEAAKRVLNEVVTTGKAIENKIALTEAKLRRLHLIPEKEEIEEDSEEMQEEKLAKQQEEYENQLKLEREQNKELERKQREFQEEKKRKHNNRAAIMRRIAELKKKEIADVQRLEKEKRDDPDRARNKKEALSFKGKPREMTCPKCGFNGLHYWFGDRWSCPTCGYCTMLSEIKRPGGMTYAEYARKIIERYDQKILKVKRDADEEIRRLEEELRE